MYPNIETVKAALLKQNYISEADSQAAETAAHDSTGYIGFLIREQLLSRQLLGQALAESYNLTYIPIDRLGGSADLLALLPEDIARTNRAVAAKQTETYVGIATDNPDKLNLQQLTKAVAPKTLRLGYALPEDIDTILGGYIQPLETRFQQIIEQSRRVAPEIVDQIVADAQRFNASDIHFEPSQAGVIVRFRVDGSLREAGNIPTEHYENILNRVKVESGMRIDEHFSAQDGSIQRRLENGAQIDLRVSLIPTVKGEKIVMRVLGNYVQGLSLDDIGLTETTRDRLESYAAKPFGMILTTGPTGSGKTTTLYALLTLLNKPDINITTIEDPVEYKLDTINQIQVREEAGMTFARGLRAIVRQDPDVILVGEIRDEETAQISVNAALTGHLLLSTFHANDAATAIPRLIDLGIEPFLLASTLQVVIAQRLVRKLCPVCRYSVPARGQLSGLKNKAAIEHYIKPEDTIYTSKGCPSCGGTGYQGRLALFEFIDMTPELQDLILTNPSTQAISELAVKQGSLPMFGDGISKVQAGLTSITELIRVVEPPRQKAPRGGKK